ncbi:phosphoglycerate mutase [Luteimonas sp. RD2P54]|uniref:Phosphoglycerate mutase n=1 Tax=Luteimonas endophytica TaxID=3042023 RepID=A0ABT6J3N7_9GAMM|nr:phosphoglycerate mutase [Luteimonas endophytica]MDH5821436.1 phosphoglycerate mutase [Luteimonas endophytica]
MAPRAVFLLPAAEAFGAQRLDPIRARALGRGDRLPSREPGPRAQLLRRFEVLPRRIPVAALTRQADAGDAAGHAWLRADPAHIRPDINGARLLACGETLGLGADDAAQLLRPLKPLFGDAGFPIDAPVPSRWYLRLPLQARLPEFAPPSEALGADLFEHIAEGVEGRRWRALLNEAQIVLHNHPWNEGRAARGLGTVNSLWFWGAGVLPDRVASEFAEVSGDDEALRALATAAGIRAVAAAPQFEAPAADALFDLRPLRDLRLFGEAWLAPALAALDRKQLATLELDLADGRGYRLARGQRWRFWRRPQAALE